MPTPSASPRRPRHLSRRSALAALALAPWSALQAQSTGGRPITLVVPFAPGGVADITARAVGAELARQLGQAVVVDNRPGAGSIVASQAVATAPPDGQTLLLMSNAHAVSAGLFKRLPYNAQRDFAPISTLGFFDLGLFVPASSRHADLQALLAHSRPRPGALTIGTIVVGSTQHLAAKLLETQAGIEAVVVPYKGSPALLQALRTGEVDLAVEIVSPMLAPVAAGWVRPLAVAAEQRHPAWPQVPTTREAGLPAFQVASWNALAVRAGTAPATVALLNRAVLAAVAAPTVQQALTPLGLRLIAGPPEALQALLAAETRRWAAVIKAAKIEPE